MLGFVSVTTAEERMQGVYLLPGLPDSLGIFCLLLRIRNNLSVYYVK